MKIVKYNDKYENSWDRFVIDESCNGTILQTRKFLNYHPRGRFTDESLMFIQGTSLFAVLPANKYKENEKNILYSHGGSTFGGLILNSASKRIDVLEEIINLFDEYLVENNYYKIVLKQTSNLYSKNESSIIDYFLVKNNYRISLELGYYIHFLDYNNDILSNYSSSRRRLTRKAFENKFEFRKLKNDDEIKIFYSILLNNYEKFNNVPVHNFEEILLLKNEILKNHIGFYGVFLEEKMVGGSMVFYFDRKIFHTQYLAANQDFLSKNPNEYLYTMLINEAKKTNFEYISFGTSVLNNGEVLNKSLAVFKSGFGTKEYINTTFTKIIGDS
ncbi:MAG: GNAT family N-acetyltransferase [Bacilli bacterium]